MEDLAIANDVPLRQDREATFREPRRLDVEFFVGFEMGGKFLQEFVGRDTAIVV